MSKRGAIVTNPTAREIAEMLGKAQNMTPEQIDFNEQRIKLSDELLALYQELDRRKTKKKPIQYANFTRWANQAMSLSFQLVMEDHGATPENLASIRREMETIKKAAGLV